jgi:hypothetical protein
VCDPRAILLADTSEIRANMSGDVILEFPNEDGSLIVNLRITGCLYVKDLGYNLISVGKLADKGITSIFRAETVELKIEPKNLIFGKGIRDRKDSSLYVLPSPKQYEHTLVSVSKTNDIGTWHKGMARMYLHDLRQAHKYSDVPKFSDVVDDGVCSPCCEWKATKLPFRGNFEHADKVGEIIHSDMTGKLPVSFPDRFQYISTFTDDNSRHISIAFMQRKSQLPKAFTAFRRELQVLAKGKLEMGEIHTSNNDDFKIEDTGIRIVQGHSDGGTENKKLERLENHLATYSAPYTPENNPISERGNRTLFDAARTLLIEAGLPTCFWPFAIKHVVYVRNRVRHATTADHDSPYYMVTGDMSNLKKLKVFGCRAYVLILPTSSKFERRAESGVPLESLSYGVYKVLVPSKDGGESKVIISRHVTFDEEELFGLKDMGYYGWRRRR